MAFRIFGFQLGRDVKPNYDTPVKPDNLDSTTDIAATVGGGVSPVFAAYAMDNTAGTENQKIRQYRTLSFVPEVEKAVDEIVSEMIIVDKTEAPVAIDLDEAMLPPNIRQVVEAEMDEALRLLAFNNRGHDIARRWYIDGRLNYQCLIDTENPQAGIQELRFIDPMKIKRVRELIKVPDQMTRTEIIKGIREYYLFSETGIDNVSMAQSPIQMTTDSVVFVHSGLHDPDTNVVLSYLDPAIRPANNLRMMEDSMVIYRLSRSAERRVFKIYTGDLPKAKAEQFVQEVANKHKNKIVYDPTTGNIKNDRRYLAMTEDYFLPMGDGGAGTTVDTLPGGENVGETGEADYFKQKLYEALRVPSSRMSDQPTLFSTGTEITRDEVRFARFISRLRKRFSALFIEIIRRNLMLKGIMSGEEFDEIVDLIHFKFAEDNYFSEAMDYNIIQQRMGIMQLVDPYVGKYVSTDYVFRKILMLDDKEIEEMRAQIANDQAMMLQQEIDAQKQRIAAGIEPAPI